MGRSRNEMMVGARRDTDHQRVYTLYRPKNGSKGCAESCAGATGSTDLSLRSLAHGLSIAYGSSLTWLESLSDTVSNRGHGPDASLPVDSNLARRAHRPLMVRR